MSGVRTAIGTVLRHPRETVVPPSPGDVGGPWVYCSTPGIDVEAENLAAIATVRAAARGHRAPYDVLVVPGYTPLDQREPLAEVHEVARRRLALAARDLLAGVAPLVLVSGGNVHPDGTPYNEAVQMKRHLVAAGIGVERIAVEPCARHSHTNLRNAGRFLIRNGLRRALVVTSADQAMYFSRPRSSTFDVRCLADLGYLVGALGWVDDHRVSFQPSALTLRRGPDPRDP